VLQSFTSLVEIDLLRIGAPMEMEPIPATDYRILVAAGWERARGTVYAVTLSQPLPDVPVPLREREAPAMLAMGTLLAEIYDRARYDLSVDYRQPPPEPALSAEDASWVDELLRASGLRE
jgi:hypothetical protein